ncbi:MAG: hypothetical protein RR893_12725, partial [Clostridia bacterium]
VIHAMRYLEVLVMLSIALHFPQVNQLRTIFFGNFTGQAPKLFVFSRFFCDKQCIFIQKLLFITYRACIIYIDRILYITAQNKPANSAYRAVCCD